MLEVQNKGLVVVVVVVVVVSDDDEWDAVEVQTGPCWLLAKMSSAILMTDCHRALAQTGVKLNQSHQKIKPLLKDFSMAKDKTRSSEENVKSTLSDISDRSS